jgi:methylthioribose-1-phosphate isomerase
MDTIEGSIQQYLKLDDTRPTAADLLSRLKRAFELHLTAREEVLSVCEAIFERGANYSEREDVGALLDAIDGAKVSDFERAIEAVKRVRTREGR